MKFFAFILAITILLQSWEPCRDNGLLTNGGNQTSTFSKHSHQKNKNHSDACSPFCQCSCCAGFTINHCAASVNSIEQPAEKHHASYLPANTIEVSIPIWQPPQLAC